MIGIGIGAGVGALCRYEVTNLIKRRWARWPLATLLINLTGAFVLGVLLTRANLWFGAASWTTGFLGGLTTFSTMNVEAVGLLAERRWFAAAGYLLLSYGGGLGLAALGIRYGGLIF